MANRKSTKKATNPGAVIALTIVAALLLGVIAAMAFTQGFTSADPYHLFSKAPAASGNDEPGLAEPQDTPDDVFVLNPISTQFVKLLAMPMSLPGSDAHNIHLTATVEPEDAEDKRMDWSIEFVNPASEWATGKAVTDYVTVTPTSDGSLEADVAGLKAFGEQIIIKCTSRANPEATASCTVDYIIRYTIDNESVSLSSSSAASKEAQLSCTLTKSDGTIDATNHMDYTFGFAEAVYQKYAEIFKKHNFQDGDLFKQTISQTSNADVLSMTYTFSLPLVDNGFEKIYGNYSTVTKLEFYKKFFPTTTASTVATTPQKQNDANAAIREWLDYINEQATSEEFSVFELKLTLNSKNEDHQHTKTSTATVRMECFKGDGSVAYKQRITEIKGSILDAVSGVQLSQGSIVF